MTSAPLVNTKQQTKNGIRYHTTEYEWNLQNLSNLPIILLQKGIKASRECYKRTTWSVEIGFESSTTKADCIKLQGRLERTDQLDMSVDTQFQLQLEDELQNRIFESSCSSVVHTNIPTTKPSLPTYMSMELNQQDGFSFSTDKLIVRVTIVVSGCCLVINDSAPQNYHFTKLKQDFQRSYTEKINPDIELACGSFTIFAHRFILCSRSPMFRRELEHVKEPMKHYLFNATGRLTQATLLFMNYLYTDEISFTPDWSILNQVFQIAEQYEVGSLQHICGQMIVRSIDLTSACVFLKTAHSTKDEALQEICMEFLGDKFSEVRATEPWVDFKRNSPLIYSEVIRIMTDRINPTPDT